MNPYAANNNFTKMVNSKASYRLRQGDYQIIYEIIDCVLIISVFKIEHRQEAYK
ncbi:MAG: hypothetical protein QG632_180 [Candidatus Dependentiae bacterium]|nr:hypothetical protein [Candidatus Dependentiae bacterium]